MNEAEAEIAQRQADAARSTAESLQKQAESLQASIAQVNLAGEMARKYEEFVHNPAPQPDLAAAQKSLPNGLRLDAK